MRRLIFVPLLIMVAVLAIAGGIGYWLYNNYNYYSTDDAQINGKILSISSPLSGQLTTLAAKQGDVVIAGQVLGTVTGVNPAGEKTMANLVSPINGTVVQSNGIQGQSVSAGLALVQVADLKNLNVIAYVDEGQISNVKLNQEVDVTVDAFKGTSYSGHVQQIVQATASQFSLLPSSDNSSGNFTKVSQRIPVIVSLDSIGSNDLVPGLSAEVTIHLH